MSGDDDDIGDMHLEDTREERPRLHSDQQSVRVPDRVSGEFLTIVEQLLAQHAYEMAQGGGFVASNGDGNQSEHSEASGPGDVALLHLRQTHGFGNVDEVQSVDSKATGQSRQRQSRPTHVKTSMKSDVHHRFRSTISEQILCRQHEAMTSLDAGKIIECLEQNAEELNEVFQERPEIDLDALPGLLSDTPTVLAIKYYQLSKFKKLAYWLQSSQYEMMLFFLVLLNVLWMAFELHVYGMSLSHLFSVKSQFEVKAYDSWSHVFNAGDVFFAVVFMIDVLLRMFVLKCSFWTNWLNYIDLAASVLSMIEVIIANTLPSPVNPIILRLVRIGKLVRALRTVTITSAMSSLQLLVKCLASSRDMLFCSFSVLAFVQCVAGVILATLCTDFIQDETQDANLRKEVFQYYGTFSRTFLSMFEIMFANWGPPCRVLVENVSEWFSVFFGIYRCVLGFAILNVMNAVFVQQTMRTAVMDEDLAFKQRQKEIGLYIKKVKTLFQGLDSSGNGSINLEEFSKLVKSDKLAFWMSQLELEYHDLLQLFEFLDNGDGQITLTEFIDGAARLRGGAKAIDVWRMETKLEVLMEEVLTALADFQGPVGRRRSTVQDVLRQSSFQFIHSNADRQRRAMDPHSNAARDSLQLGEDVELEALLRKDLGLKKSKSMPALKD